MERVEAFLVARIARAAAATRGSDERQAARAVQGALLVTAGNLGHHLREDTVPLDPQEEAKRRLLVQTAWNTLYAMVQPWMWHDEYDQLRWRPARHWDAQGAEAYERRLREVFEHERGTR
ncbi:hypothetical protein [Streptomyces sp. NPDC059564]|uniref:hypothetical protein n=1 Tax=Streptomyces sp. NPDC059564 TaxID=3346865 RepID=UPI0036BF2CD9